MYRTLFFLVIAFTVKSQQELGIANSNYYPSSSIHLNASSSVDSRTYMQFHLVGTNTSVKTNAAYIPKFSFWNYLSTREVPPIVQRESRVRNFLYGNAALEGPAFMISKGIYGGGFFVRARSVVDVRRIPYRLTELLMNQDFSDTQEQEGELELRNAKMSNMSWAEYGLNFGMMVHRKEYDLITVGVSLKYLTGINLSYANISDLTGTYGPNVVVVDNLQGRLRDVAPAWNSGRGFGGDLGVTYKRMLSHIDKYESHSKKSKCTFVDYKYKIGLSLRDAGYIKFRRGTSKTELSGSGTFYTLPDDSTYQERLSAYLSEETTYGEPVTAVLPSAVSGQFDYNFENNFYLNLTVNKSIVPNGVVGVQSMDLVSLTPRFETKNIEVAMPVTFHKFIYPQVGLGFRVRSFALGVDNVVPFIIASNTSGIGVYAHLAIALYRNPACAGKVRGIADCMPQKSGNKKIKRKNTLLSPKPRKR